MSAAIMHRLRTVGTILLAAVVFGCTWLLRFNDPGGSYAGLTDDHFFYLVRGWQILFGDLPVRDFVDQGAPLYYYTGAAVQMLFGRGTLSEFAFSVTVLAASAAIVFWLSARASGSILAALLGTVVHVHLGPRFYNYPKILVYALAIPLLWRFADQPTARRRFWLAVITVVGFLFRHDHGVFVALATAALIAMLPRLSMTERLRHAGLYAAACVVLLAPYLVFVQLNGGLLSYAQQVASWAERERERTPIEWPGLFDYPDGAAGELRADALDRAVDAVQANIVAWMYYAELILPVVALLLIASSLDGFRPGWPRAREKLAVVAVLALVLDAGFLRSPLEARLADPSVPHAILIAWLPAALTRVLFTGRWVQPRARRYVWPIRAGAVVVAAGLALVLWALLSQDFRRRMERASFTEGVDAALRRSDDVVEQLRRDWRLDTWETRASRPELMELALYVNACTAPGDRVFVQAYMPQVLALARRAFAGGHADLRPGFFVTEEAQRLTVSRLQRQSVPILLLETGAASENFRRSFPRVTAYIDQQYRPAGSRNFDDRFGTALFVRRDRTPTGSYGPLGWPCFGPGTVQP